MNEYTLSPTSQRDLVAAGHYAIERTGDLEAGERVLAALVAVLEKLAELPTMGRSRAELRPRMRSFPVNPLAVYYRRTRYGIHVMRILHQREDVQQAFPKRSTG